MHITVPYEWRAHRRSRCGRRWRGRSGRTLTALHRNIAHWAYVHCLPGLVLYLHAHFVRATVIRFDAIDLQRELIFTRCLAHLNSSVIRWHLGTVLRPCRFALANVSSLHPHVQFNGLSLLANSVVQLDFKGNFWWGWCRLNFALYNSVIISLILECSYVNL